MGGWYFCEFSLKWGGGHNKMGGGVVILCIFTKMGGGVIIKWGGGTFGKFPLKFMSNSIELCTLYDTFVMFVPVN